MDERFAERWPSLWPVVGVDLARTESSACKEDFNVNRGKNMFEQFKDNSIKVIKASGLIFELIAEHEVRAISVETRHLDKLKEHSTFAIECADAAIICSVVDLYASSVDRNFSVIEFEINYS